MYGTVMRKYKAWDGTGDEDRNMSGMKIKARRESFGECEGVFISFKLFSPADGHP